MSYAERFPATEALREDIAVMEKARDALPVDSHLRTLCNLAMEHLRVLIELSDRPTHQASGRGNAPIDVPAASSHWPQPRSDGPEYATDGHFNLSDVANLSGFATLTLPLD